MCRNIKTLFNFEPPAVGKAPKGRPRHGQNPTQNEPPKDFGNVRSPHAGEKPDPKRIQNEETGDNSVIWYV